MQPIDRPIPAVSTDCNRDQTARALYDDVDRKVARIELGDTPQPRAPQVAKVGSGFYVNQGDEIVTNVHVALSGSYADVLDRSGHYYHAKIEKLDTENDLALLKVEGLPPDPGRALKIDASPLQPHQNVIAYGHPSGDDNLWASPGYYQKTEDFAAAVSPEAQSPDVVHMTALTGSPDPIIAAEAQAYLDAPRMEMVMSIQHGNSGGPLVDENEKVRGVAADRLSARHSLFIPADKLQKFLNEPEKKFKYNYQKDANGDEHLLNITRLDGSIAEPIWLHVPKDGK